MRTAVVGHFTWDDYNPLDTEGRIRPDANAWATQFRDDLEALKGFAEGLDFHALYDGSTFNLFGYPGAPSSDQHQHVEPYRTTLSSEGG